MTTLSIGKEDGRRTAEKYTPIVTIYADASCLRNGAADSSAGGGAVIIDRNRSEVKLVARYLGTITNQQAEILACVKALEELRRPCRVEIFSDSCYVIDTMNGRNRMKTNRPFWDQLIEQSYGHHITWRWVKGHDGATFQEAADRLARAASTAGTDLLSADLDFLAQHLSNECNQLSIRSFEFELDKIVSRYGQDELMVPATRFDGPGAYPSAFSAERQGVVTRLVLANP
ncbi:MAG: ribonuclease HI [Pyrinomonadaceae bacterium]